MQFGLLTALNGNYIKPQLKMQVKNVFSVTDVVGL